MKREEAVQEIRKQFEKKRRAAHRRQEEKMAALYDRYPDLARLERQITQKGLALTRAMLADPEQQQKLLEQVKSEMNSLKHQREQLMSQYRLTEADFDPRWECDRCEDRGTLRDGRYCHCFQQALIRYRYEESNLAGILEKENFDTFDPFLFSPDPVPGESLSPQQNMRQEIYPKCMEFVRRFDHLQQNNLLFYGPTGLGKTFMANCIAKALLDQGRLVLYQTAIRLMDLLRAHYFAKDEQHRDPKLLDHLFGCDLLIIDDLGTELSNTFTNSQLFQLINTRQLDGKKTLLSTNLPPRELMERYDDRICSRLFAHFTFLKFFGPDVRWESQMPDSSVSPE